MQNYQKEIESADYNAYAKAEEEDILKGLNIGADDYITKPFSPKQLVARVTAVLRRTSDDPVPLSNIFSFNNGDLVIDSLKYEVRKGNNVVNLTPNEYKILMTLVKYPGKTFTRTSLSTWHWGMILTALTGRWTPISKT